MNTKMKLLAGIIAGSALFSTAHAATVNTNASVTVQNTINLTKVTDLDLGTIAAFADTAGNNQSSLVLSADPAVTPAVNNHATDSKIVLIAPGTPAEFSVTSAAPNHALNITLPTSVTLTGGLGSMTFELTDFVHHAHIEGNSQTTGSTTTAAGELGFYVGATLSTSNAGVTTATNDPYENATYTGTFDVAVNY